MKDVRGQSLRRGQHVVAIDPSDGVYHPGMYVCMYVCMYVRMYDVCMYDVRMCVDNVLN